MSKTISMSPIAMTQENSGRLQSLFGNPTAHDLKVASSSADAAKLISTDTHNGHTMRVYQVDASNQIGVLTYADGRVSLYSPVPVLLAISADGSGNPTGVVFLNTANGKMGAKGNTGSGVYGEAVTPNFANDVMHIMHHDPEVSKPHSCSAPPPAKHGPSCKCC